MAVSADKRCITVALVGNPNTGKSTLFSALVGVYQRVGNYPGVTVEKRTGRFEFAGQSFEVTDLPGLYSLAPRSRDELVAVDVLLGREPGVEPIDIIVCVVDASNLERNLYLVSQLLELSVPTVIALNMMDVAERQGIQIDSDELARRLNVPVVPIQAHRGLGVGRLRQVLAELADSPRTITPLTILPQAFGEACEQLLSELEKRDWLKCLSPQSSSHLARGEATFSQPNSPLKAPAYRFWAGRLLLDSTGFLQKAIWGERVKR